MARNLQYPPSVKPGIPRLGETPEGWSRVTFGDVLQVVEREAQLNDDDEYQLVVARRNRGGIAPREKLLGREILTKSQFLTHSGDFLISKRQIVHGACGIVPPELHGSVVSNEYAVLHARNGLNLKYLEYYTHSLHFQQTCFHASVGVAVEKMIFRLDEWLRHEFHLPPHEVQERIVAVLHMWDRSIELTHNLIMAHRRLKQGVARALFTRSRRIPGFTSEWTKVSLASLGKCIRGVSYDGDTDLLDNDTDESVRLLRAGNITNGCIVHEDLQYVQVSKVTSAQILQENDVVICMSSGSKALVGKAARYVSSNGHKYTVGAFCSIFRPESGWLPNLVSHIFETYTYRKWISILTAGSSINNLTPKDIESFTMPLPTDCKEQERIAEILGAIDREIVLLERKLKLLVEQKQGLMQKLFAGQLEVKQ